MEITEVKEFVKKYPAIHSWLHNIQGDILLPCRLVHYARGKSLFRRGDEVKKVYLICAGEVDGNVCRSSPGGSFCRRDGSNVRGTGTGIQC